MRLTKILFALATTLAACACATQKQQPNINLGGYPPAFRAGYIDGCENARRSGTTIRDEAKFKSDPMYAAGWRDGVDICARKKK